MLNFFLTGRKLFFASSVNNINLFCAKTLCTTSGIHCNITAADNCNLLCVHNRSCAVILISLHKVCSCEELICRVNTAKVLTGDIHKSRQTCTGTDDDSLKALLKQLVYLDGTTYYDVGVNLNAHSNKVIYLVLYDGLRQSELRDTVNQNAACKVESLKYGHIITQLCKVACACQTGGSCADYSYLVAVGSGHCGSLC